VTAMTAIICILLATALLHWLVLALIPRLKMWKAMKQVVSIAGVNTFSTGRRSTAIAETWSSLRLN